MIIYILHQYVNNQLRTGSTHVPASPQNSVLFAQFFFWGGGIFDLYIIIKRRLFSQIGRNYQYVIATAKITELIDSHHQTTQAVTEYSVILIFSGL